MRTAVTLVSWLVLASASRVITLPMLPFWRWVLSILLGVLSVKAFDSLVK